MIIYKIRHTDSGFYSTGGTTPKWNKNGKTWNNIGHLKSHLRTYISANTNKKVSKELIQEMFRGWQIVPIKMVAEDTIDPVSLLSDIK